MAKAPLFQKKAPGTKKPAKPNPFAKGAPKAGGKKPNPFAKKK